MLCCLLFIAACKKELLQTEKPADNEIKIANISLHTIPYSQFIDKIDLSKLGFLAKPLSASGKDRNFQVQADGMMPVALEAEGDSVKVLKRGDTLSYVIAIKPITPRAVSFQNLTIQIVGGKTTAFISNYVPTKRWVEAWRAKHPIAFEGELNIKEVLLSSVPVKAQRSSTVQTINVCTTYWTYEFISFPCAGPPDNRHYPGEPGCSLQGQQGGPRVEMYTVPHIQCETSGGETPPADGGGGNNGGSTTPNPPGGYDPCESGPVAVTSTKKLQNHSIFKLPPSDCEPQSIPDCANVVGGTAYIDPNCNTCIGGTTGKVACPPKRTVTDSTTNPCIKAAVGLGIQANTTIGGMLNETFGPSNEYGGLDIEFKEGNTGTDDGWCRKNGNISWLITINQNLPNTSSKELILATVYHEILHAYLEASYPKDATGMFLIPHDEHQDMAEKYLTLMIGALKINYPNISDKDAWGLAWGGLHETPFYKDNAKLTVVQRIEIGEINRKHTNKNNVLDRSGTYCN